MEENRLHSHNTHLLSYAYHIPRVYHVYYYIIYQFAVRCRVPISNVLSYYYTNQQKYVPAITYRYSVIYADGTLLPRENESVAI